jgi:peptidoglycan hydrolase-like protein with peptidoglycan-binding domain
MTQQLNENPLIAALMGALVGMGLEREKAKKAAAQAVDQAQNNPAQSTTPAAPKTGGNYKDVMRKGSRGTGVKTLQANLGMRGKDADGIFGPETERRVKQFQQSQGLKVDGIVGPETKARIQKLAGKPNAKSVPSPTFPQGSGIQVPTEGAQMTNKNQINEDITISGDAEDLLRMMQLAGAKGAKTVDVDDINPGQTCGHRNGDLARSIELMADEDWDNSPDEDVKDFEATPPTNDLNKAKKSYAPTNGGDNPMALEASLKEKLLQALESKKKNDVEEGERHGNDNMYDKCWDGYEKVPGKKRGEKGSCRKK